MDRLGKYDNIENFLLDATEAEKKAVVTSFFEGRWMAGSFLEMLLTDDSRPITRNLEWFMNKWLKEQKA